MVSAKEQLRIITQGTLKIVDEEELLRKLERSVSAGQPLRIKLGLDPSAPDIHIGHAVVLRKLRQMQNLGHEVTIIIGDFTGRIGDPTGKAKGRVALSDETVRKNAQTYCEQIFKVLDCAHTTVRFNSEWLAELKFEEILRLASTTTVARLLERDDFERRFTSQVPIGLHEFFYPLMQAYDSVELRADIELGGTDQTFNILMGRNLMRAMNMEPQVALFVPILEGLDGVEKMSKSLGNYIGVNESAEVMYKKVMEVPDSLIVRYFELATDEHPDSVEEIRRRLEEGTNPRDIKRELARTITSLYHDPDSVEEAIRFYDAAFSRKAIPDNIPVLTIESNTSTLLDAVPQLVAQGFAKSKSEFIRLVRQGGVQRDGERLEEDALREKIPEELILRIGKKCFVRLVQPMPTP